MSLAQTAALCLGLLVVVTLTAGLAVRVVPGAALTVRAWLPRHETTLAHTAGEAATIALQNTALLGGVLALVIVLSRLGWRTVGDVAVAVFAARQAIVVGAAIGAYGPGLLRYLPQLPIEWAGIAVPVGAWMRARVVPLSARQVVALAATIVALLGVAAIIETFCTPG